jgi:hypothetical protein
MNLSKVGRWNTAGTAMNFLFKGGLFVLSGKGLSVATFFTLL